MRLDRVIRWAMAIGVMLLTLLVLGIVLYMTESFFAVWDRLQQAPRGLFFVYVSLLVIFLVISLMTLWKLLAPKRRSRLGEREKKATEAGVQSRLESAVAAGVDVTAVESELGKLTQRRGSDEVWIAFFGEVSSGKSSLIKTLLDERDDIDVSVRGGSTRQVQEYRHDKHPGWVLVDVPGLNEANATLDQLALDEAHRAHVVVYVCDSDVTRTEFDQLAVLVALGKPIVLTLNKSDLLNQQEQQLVLSKIKERLKTLPKPQDRKSALHVVSSHAAGREEVVRIMPNGAEELSVREIPADVLELTKTINALVTKDRAKLDQLRDSAVFALAAQRLDSAEASYRQKESEAIVNSYTRKAVVGALAAIAPGSDLIIQGVLATALTREMCALYDAPLRDLDTDQFLKEAQKHVGKAIPVMLAVAGNALKAFPGVGTVAGGFTHAIAYGLIFDALGRSLATTLADGNGFHAGAVSSAFKESLNSDLETRTSDIARMVMAARKELKRSDPK